MRKINAHCVRMCVCIWRSLWLFYTHIYVFTNTLKYLHHIFSHLAGFLVSVFWFLVSGFWFCGLHCALNWNVLNKPIKIKITVALCHAPSLQPSTALCYWCQTADRRQHRQAGSGILYWKLQQNYLEIAHSNAAAACATCDNLWIIAVLISATGLPYSLFYFFSSNKSILMKLLSGERARERGRHTQRERELAYFVGKIKGQQADWLAGEVTRGRPSLSFVNMLTKQMLQGYLTAFPLPLPPGLR